MVMHVYTQDGQTSDFDGHACLLHLESIALHSHNLTLLVNLTAQVPYGLSGKKKLYYY